jgi:hypothetical protein
METNKTNTKLTKAFILQRFIKLPPPTFFTANIKQLAGVYNEDSLSPISSREFTLPMSRAIMPPWKVDGSSNKGGYIKKSYRQYEEFDDGDKGIMIANENKHSNMNNAPLWFDSKETAMQKEDFSMEGIANRQFSIEEEKANFRKKAEDPGKKDIEDIFASFEDGGEFSSVDVKFEKSLKKESFKDPAIAAATGTIDISELESEIIKDTEEAPVWNSYTAEEIKNESQKHMDNWGVSTDIHYGSEEIAALNGNYQEMNPFCHSSLNAKELDRVWYYNDNQNCIQGPFNSIEMYEWYKGGYFHPGLLLRCGKYSAFITLRDFFISINYESNELQSPDRVYYGLHDLAMEDLAGRFSSLSIENPRPYYHPTPMLGYIAQMPAYFQNYPSPSYVSRTYDPSIGMRPPHIAPYQPEQRIFYSNIRPSYR